MTATVAAARATPKPGARRGKFLYRAALGLVLLAAAGLRFDGLDWGRPFTYHPDEHSVVHAALNMVREGDPNPHWFRYPSLLLYLEAILVAGLQPWVQADLRTAPEVTGLGPWDVAPHQFPFVLAGRTLVAVFGLASVYATARLAGAAVSPAAALLAAALLAASPLHVESSHYLTTDVPAMFWIVLALLVALTRTSTSGWAVSGAAAGLAAATKYPAGMVLLMPVGVSLYERRWSSLAAVLAAFALAFTVTSPFVWLDFSTFLSDLRAQRAHYASGVASAGENLVKYGLALVLYALGPWASVLAAAGVAAAWLQRRVSRSLAVVLVALPLAYVGYISTWPLRFERNLMPVMPFVCLWAAVGWEALRAGLGHLSRRTAGALAAALALLALAQPVRSSLELRQRWHLPDTRTLAYQWVEDHLPRGSHIVREEYTPQVDGKTYRVTFVQVAGTRPYSWYLSEKVDYLILSSNIYDRFRGSSPQAAAIAQFYEFVFGSLPLLAEFTPGAGRAGPTIRIYEIPRWRDEGEARHRGREHG